MTKHYEDDIEEILVDALNGVVEIFEENDVCLDCGLAKLVTVVLAELMHHDKKVKNDLDATLWLASFSRKVLVEWQRGVGLDEREQHVVH